MRRKTITIIFENLLYGGTTSHLINFMNSKACRKFYFTIITNKNKEKINIKLNIPVSDKS